MQLIPDQLRTAIKRSHHIKTPEAHAIAEFNFNSFELVEVTNGTVKNEDSTWPYNWNYFPIESITEDWRPNAGINYAITDDAWTTQFGGVGIDSMRYYTCEEDELYKYWISPTASVFSVDGENFPIEDCQPTVIYKDTTVRANKIKVIFAMDTIPTQYTIDITTNGTTWTTIATNPNINLTTGVCEIWWNGTAWTETQNLDENIYKTIKGLRLTVSAVDKTDAQMGLIELSARREVDLTQRIEDMSFRYTLSEVDFMHPVGVISSNSGSLTVNNYDKKMSEMDVNSPYYGILDRRCQIRCYVSYDLSEFGGPADYNAMMGTMYTNMWEMEDEWEYNLELFDCMKQLQQTDCPAIFVEDVSIVQLVSRILDLAGFSNYQFQLADFNESAVINYFWTDGTKTFYEVLKGICDSHQCAIWVDEYGQFQLATRNELTDVSSPTNWTFLYQDKGEDLSEILKLKRVYDIQANEVNIKYRKMAPKTDVQDLADTPLTDILWEGSDTVVLRAAPITKEMPSTGDTPSIWVTPDVASRWPYTGRINIDGEMFEIEGKGYTVWSNQNAANGGTKKDVKILNIDEKRKHDVETYKSNGNAMDTKGRNNAYTGELFVTKRDLDKVGANKHAPYIADGWTGMEAWIQKRSAGQWRAPDNRWLSYQTTARPVGDWRTKKNWGLAQRRWSWKDSILTVDSNDLGTWESQPCFMRWFDTSEYREFGTRINFVSGFSDAGIMIAPTNFSGFDTGDGGIDPNANIHKWFQLHIMTTETIDKIGRTKHNEIWMERKEGDTATMLPIFGLGAENTRLKGVTQQIFRDKWYDVEVIHNDFGHYDGRSVSTFEVFLNGQYVASFYNPTGRVRQTNVGGVFVRNKGVTKFEHFYATTVSDKMNLINTQNQDFGAFTVQLPAGTNQKQMIDFPTQSRWMVNIALTMATTGASANIKKMEVHPANEPGMKATKKVLNPFTLEPDRRPYWEVPYIGKDLGGLYIEYDSPNNISVCIEHSTRIVSYIPFGYNAPNDEQIYDISGGGYISDKWGATTYGNNTKPNSAWGYSRFGVQQGNTFIPRRKIFFDDFGSIAHEVRDFDVELQKEPGVATKVQTSNDKVRVISETYNPRRGIFTLANASRRDEIVVGTETLSDSESIDHSLYVYGYVLQDKGEETEEVKNELEIKRRGRVKLDIQADWIHTEEQAKALGKWITDHWSEPMDAIELEVFANTFTQIGDKVQVDMEDSNVRLSYIWIVHSSNRSFSDDALKSSLTLHRIR